MNQANIKKLISGQKTGLGAAVFRLILGIISVGYSIVVQLRNLSYAKGFLKIHRAKAVVFSIGNITVGGTGKTPLVVWLCNRLSKNYNCAILTRGYKSAKDPTLQNYSDEVAILAESSPQTTVIVNPDRVAGAAEAINKIGAKVLIMDDGFQHRRLARDLDIVTIDATCPFGYDKILPAGLLREPVASLKRADAVVITRCDQVAEDELSELENKLRVINPNMIIARSTHAPVCVRSKEKKEISIEQLKGKKIFAFCGIGNPDAFFNTIKALGTKMVGSRIYNDHYHYTESCLADIYEQAEHNKADLILTTQKDLTKIALLRPAKKDILLAYLAIEIKFLAGEDKLTALIDDTLAGKISGK